MRMLLIREEQDGKSSVAFWRDGALEAVVGGPYDITEALKVADAMVKKDGQPETIDLSPR